MSGPYCETCTYYQLMPIFNIGECTDPSKIIYGKTGDRICNEPEVMPSCSCQNHKSVLGKEDA